MIINHVPEEGRSGDEEVQHLEDNCNEYQTADELFELMAKNNIFDGDGDKTLTSDLVILYKNIGIDNKLLSNSNQQTSRSPNQYVETVIYNDDLESVTSDNSENTSNEDLNDIFAINKSRIDLLNIGDSLCHKFGIIDMQKSDLTTAYDKHFLFSKPFVKEQLKSFYEISKSKLSDSTVLPASLLDYVCCQRLENNFNFNMDNIIKYVQHTIAQLRRISNGDYLTDKAKEKWREVDSVRSQKPESNKTVLTSSTTIPLAIVGKLSGYKSTWDDIVHSEMDVRSLCKILEKKIIVEVPKILCGSYRLFSKRCKDNLIITCQQDKQFMEHEVNEESRVDVVLKLQRSKSGHVISNIDSIMILKSLPTFTANTERISNDLLALEFDQDKFLDQKLEPKDTIIEFNESDKEIIQPSKTDCDVTLNKNIKVDKLSETNYNVPLIYKDRFDGDKENDNSRAEANFDLVATGDLHRTIHRLNVHSPVIEESEDNTKKNKSPTRVRIKSPYENKSHIIEEKKRKRLLEIRDKRDKKKIAMSENCKITKHKYGRGAIMPQASNSVTKLSITNKAFYNSIYGQTTELHQKMSRKHKTDQKIENVPTIELGDYEDGCCKNTPLTTPEKNSLKYINRSYYLDDADTEVMHLPMKQDEVDDETKYAFTPTSPLYTNDASVNLKLLKQINAPSTIDFSLTNTSSSLKRNVSFDDNFANTETVDRNNDLTSSSSAQVIVSTNTPNKEKDEENCKNTSTNECRKSIAKIYNLIKKASKTHTLDLKSSQSKIASNIDKMNITPGRGNSSIQASDSGTSIKHQLTSSNPSCFSFEKTNTEFKTPKYSNKKQMQTASFIPKVIISSKLQNNKFYNKVSNKDNKILNPSKIQENPLKAISQLIHEFENVQKTRHKKGNEMKRSKNLTPNDKIGSRQNSFMRTSKQDHNMRDVEPARLSFREKRREGLTTEQFQTESNMFDKKNIKEHDDIIDEIKELRGEAVRGPSKTLSRLNSLAQPKKIHVQARHETVQNKFTKRILSDRTHRLPTSVTAPERSIGSTNLKSKPKKSLDGFSASTSQYTAIASPSERLSSSRRPVNSSPSSEANRKRSSVPTIRSSLKHNVPDPPKDKMAAVETYVKSHYGRSPLIGPCNTHNAQKSRVPLIPTDIDLASLTSSRSTEESNVLGKKLHYMIESMINTNVPTLSVLTECQESTYILDREQNDSLAKCDEAMSGSDNLDIFKDKDIVTAVSSIPKDKEDNASLDVNNIDVDVKKSKTQQSYSPNELKELENALCHQISSDTYQKRLRIKNFTLTPNHSMEKVFILHSGDADSLVLKSTLSKLVNTVKILPVLSNNCIDIGFTKFPTQIATAGYVFPNHCTNCDSMPKIRYLDDTKLNALKAIQSESILSPKCNKSIQCLNGARKKSTLELTGLKELDFDNFKDKNQAYLMNSKVTNPTKVHHNKENVSDNFAGTDNFDSNREVDIKTKNSDSINTTSLDVLVGLLNEIKKITSFQPLLNEHGNSSTVDLKSKELEIILSRVAVQESSVEYSINNGASMISLDNLQQLNACASNCSLILSSDIEKHAVNTKINKNVTTSTTTILFQPLGVDKEYPTIFQKEYIHRFTEVPSQFFPIAVSANVTDSLIKLINKSSSQSVDNSISNRITALPFIEVDKSFQTPCILEIEYARDQSYELIELDPVMKMKKDILVTVYSILVLTVFAALSFSEIVYPKFL